LGKKSASSLPKSLGLLAALGVALVRAATGCGGAEFSDGTVAGAAGGSTLGEGGADQAGTSPGGAPGAGGSAPMHCRGPEDCSDRDPCTEDICRRNGTCITAPKCAGDQKCCEGDCGECCEDADCDDGTACTDDICFAGACQHQPSLTSCGAGRYCSLTDGCVSQEACKAGDPAACDDGSSCTADSCQASLCVHAFCDDATRCCPDLGCAEQCCSNQECDADDDPCTVGVCTAGKCSQTPRCSDGEQCCPGRDGSATCGSCCSAADCSDDVVCTVDACIEGRCFHAVGQCDAGYSCDPTSGCKRDVECRDDGDCSSKGCGHCREGVCAYGCEAGQVCCNNSCQGCCTADDCFDGIDCTDNFCVEGQCQFTPNNKNCPLLQTCKVAKRGCALL